MNQPTGDSVTVIENHPIFDQVARDFRDRERFDLFTVVVSSEYNHGKPPAGELPSFEDFETSYPHEWMLYHSPNTNTAIKLDPWIMPGDHESAFMECKHKVPYAYACPTCDWGEPEHNPPMLVDIAEAIQAGVEDGVIEVFKEPDPLPVDETVEQKKFDDFWNGQRG